MRYLVVINDDEARDNGAENTFEDVKYEVGELLRIGYYEVEAIQELEGGVST